MTNRAPVFFTASVLAALSCPPTILAGTIDTVAGNGAPDNNGDHGVAVETAVGDPFGVEIGPDGALYVTEVRNHRVRRIDLKTGNVRTVAGNGQKGYSGDGGPATKARLNEPYEVRFDADGNMLFVEMQNHIVRRVDAKTGIISTVAGTGQVGDSGDGGPAVDATFNRPHSIALDSKGHLYIADIGNHRIRRVNVEDGTIDSIAGTRQKKLPVDGQIAKGNPILGPRALFITKDDTMWIALREGHSLWRMSLEDGRLHHVAGTGDKGYQGDGGPAKAATFNGPKGVAVGPDGDVYIVDTENQVIRRFDTKTNTVATVAGNGTRGGDGDSGPATQAQLARPHGICVDSDGVIYIGDTLNHRVRRVR